MDGKLFTEGGCHGGTLISYVTKYVLSKIECDIWLIITSLSSFQYMCFKLPPKTDETIFVTSTLRPPYS